MTAHLLHDAAPEGAFDDNLFDAAPVVLPKTSGRFTCNDPLASVVSIRVLKSRLSDLKRGWAPDWKDRALLARWLAGEAVR